jgi:predicted nucleic acid-binding protein
VTRVVVADTSPLNYLVLIGHADILSALFERVFVPAIVRDELQNLETPQDVRNWIAARPDLLDDLLARHS